LDFLSDAFASGRRFRVPAMVDTSLSGLRVT
jgi:hypothetical protein